jgi:hypothetical protein
LAKCSAEEWAIDWTRGSKRCLLTHLVNAPLPHILTAHLDRIRQALVQYQRSLHS